MTFSLALILHEKHSLVWQQAPTSMAPLPIDIIGKALCNPEMGNHFHKGRSSSLDSKHHHSWQQTPPPLKVGTTTPTISHLSRQHPFLWHQTHPFDNRHSLYWQQAPSPWQLHSCSPQQVFFCRGLGFISCQHLCFSQHAAPPPTRPTKDPFPFPLLSSLLWCPVTSPPLSCRKVRLQKVSKLPTRPRTDVYECEVIIDAVITSRFSGSI